MDESAVLTIDAWCQRVLAEQAFDTGSLFDETLIADERALRRMAVHDYWRQHGYPLSGSRLQAWLARYPTIDALFDDVSSLLAEQPRWPVTTESLEHCIDQALEAHRRKLEALSAGWIERAQAMRDWLDTQLAEHRAHWQTSKLKAAIYHGWLGRLTDWARQPASVELSLTDTALQRLSRDGLMEVRSATAPHIEIPAWFDALGELATTLRRLPHATTALRVHAASHIAQRLAELKSHARSFSFADSLVRLEQSLTGANGERLRATLLTRYPVALIDEFQDTSPQQYRLFDALYRCADNDPDQALLLIGDPKQSIYRFRGADIYSYLRAREATAGRHYSLGVNHRSTTELVEAVNTWFERAEARTSVNATTDHTTPAGAFLFRRGGRNPMPFAAVRAKDLPDRLRDATGRAPAITIEHDLTVRSARASQRVFAQRCAERIAGWLVDAQAGFEHPDTGRTRLRPRDIAVLVRTGAEARAVRHELSRRGIHSVYLSEQDSIFDTDEARDLLRLLRAVAAPTNGVLLRTALATRTMGLSMAELEQIADDDEIFDQHCDQVRRLRQVWSERGVLAMLRRGLHEWELPARWRNTADAERRITNVLHLAELLQHASTELDGEQALIRWLASRIADASETRADEHLLRLESDADLIRVVTLHKSKGLEYPVVCLPFACSMKQVTRKKTDHVVRINETGERVLALDPDDDDLALADLERLREDLRLFYVGLTRARHAIWMGFGLQKIGNNAQCMTHLSAAGQLLGGTQAFSADDWSAALAALAHDAAARHNCRIALDPVPAESAVTQVPPDPALPLLAPHTTYAARFERQWSPASYSLLTRNLDSMSFAPAQVRGRAADESDEADHNDPIAIRAALAPWYRFPGGTASGDFIHGLLEWLDREGFALQDRPAMLDKLEARCQRAGRAVWFDTVRDWLIALLDTRLPMLDARLCDLHSRIPEMEFWVPATRLQVKVVDALCQRYLLGAAPRPELPERQLNGMLMGFADLVFEHGGRYWVLDYKTNRLGRDTAAYEPSALEAEMARHRYDVQAALYLLALHRLLRARLGDSYLPEQHLGGALYWFVRGIESPSRGEYAIRADREVLALVESLDRAFHPKDLP
jgi:exodeoxyribonuclease V beta subunit